MVVASGNSRGYAAKPLTADDLEMLVAIVAKIELRQNFRPA